MCLQHESQREFTLQQQREPAGPLVRAGLQVDYLRAGRAGHAVRGATGRADSEHWPGPGRAGPGRADHPGPLLLSQRAPAPRPAEAKGAGTRGGAQLRGNAGRPTGDSDRRGPSDQLRSNWAG